MKPTSEYIIEECEAIRDMLLSKNEKYGDAAMSGGILYDISPLTAIKARINDKLMRMRSENNQEDEDVERDLIGYLILLRIAKKRGE